MAHSLRPWVSAGLPPGAYDALADGLSASHLWSLLLDVAQVRATNRPPAALIEQWDRDPFVQPGIVDQRTHLEVDTHLLEAASAFESIELSPVAPLGVCTIMGHASQNKVLSALRGTEVVADPTNVMALECARRLRRDPVVVRLATSHRCVRAQPIPKGRGLTSSFRIFCLASAGLERQNHAFVVEAVAEHMLTMSQALDRLQQHGFEFPGRRIKVLTREDRDTIGDRIVAALGDHTVERARLDHPYYNHGIRFQISVRSPEGIDMPLIDGGRSTGWRSSLQTAERSTWRAVSGRSSCRSCFDAHESRLLVHCAANYRVTAFVGLYRTIRDGWKPAP